MRATLTLGFDISARDKNIPGQVADGSLLSLAAFVTVLVERLDPTRRSRNQKLRREIRISNLEIRNNIKAESSKRSSLDCRRFEFFPVFGFSICFEIRVLDFGFK